MKAFTSWMKEIVALLAAAALGLAVLPAAAGGQDSSAQVASTSTTGSGARFTTTIDRKTQGELKPEDLRQASLLGSRIVLHVNNAARYLADDQPQKAKPELEHAQSLAKLVRELLPITMVTTSVKDAKGNEVYRYEDRVQEDRIPIFEGMIAVDVVRPIVEAKSQEAKLKGLQLADTEVIKTSVLLDLDLVERQIQRALAQLAKPKDALAALKEAQDQGVIETAHKENNPLLAAQSALRLAEQQVRDGKFEGASANLQLARVQLEAYRTLVGEAAGQSVTQLDQEINTLQQKIREPGAADKIRGFWNRVTGWFSVEPGTAHQTTEKEASFK